MVRKDRKKTRKSATSFIVEHGESVSNGLDDPWASIENDEAVTARQVFYKPSSPKPHHVKHYEEFKNKKKRISDGLDAERVEVHSALSRGLKRTISDASISNGNDSPAYRTPLKRKRSDAGNKVNVFADVIKTRSTADSTKRNKKKRPYSADMADTNENDENDENLDAFESEDSYECDKDENLNNNLSGMQDDEGDTVDDEEQSDSDEQVSGEDFDDELDGETGFEVDSKTAQNGEILENYCGEDNETSDEDESQSDESDEEEDGILHDSTSLVDDKESDEEGNLREEREATVLQYSKGDATSYLPDFDEFPFTDNDSSVTATRAFAWMITPCDVQTFFREFFQCNALISKRNSPNYYANLFSTQRFVEMVENNYLEYGTNINIAEYKEGTRFTMNGTGRVYPNHLKEHIAVGRSVQFVNPQAFDDRVWYLCEILQELFGCFVGANTYLTPAGSAGFAPHWDEIDAFLLQLEGKKYWKVFAPDSVSEELPRESSGNFTDDDMMNRKPTFEGWIEAGDLMYIPRGFIHQAHTSDDVHSLHITISSGRHWSFADLMDKLVPEAITALAKNRWKMRKSLPVGMLDMGGVAGIDYRLEEHFEEKWKAVLSRHMVVLRNSLKEVCDGGIDVMAREFMKTALPPMLTKEEKALSVLGSRSDILHGKPMEFRPSTKVKLIRRHAQRLIFQNEDDCYIIHRMANSRVYEGRPEQIFEMPNEFISGFNALSVSYPEWMSLSEMPDDMTGKEVQGLCHLLYYHGLIMVQQLPDRVKRKIKRAK